MHKPFAYSLPRTAPSRGLLNIARQLCPLAPGFPTHPPDSSKVLLVPLPVGNLVLSSCSLGTRVAVETSDDLIFSPIVSHLVFDFPPALSSPTSRSVFLLECPRDFAVFFKV